MPTNPLQQLRSEWQRNQRLRIGLYLIALIGLWLASDMLSGYTDEQLAAHRQLQSRLTKIQNVMQQKDWPEKALQISNNLLNEENRLWQSSSSGQAQADLQTWFSQQLKTANVQGYNLKVDKAKQVEGKAADIWRVSVVLEGNMGLQQVLKILSAIEASPRTLIIDRIEIKQTNTTRLSMAVTAFYSIQEKT